MRDYTEQHKGYCGVDLHARTMYLCIVNQADEILYHKEIPTHADLFLDKLAPSREEVVVCVECVCSPGIGLQTWAPPKGCPVFEDTRSI